MRSMIFVSVGNGNDVRALNPGRHLQRHIGLCPEQRMNLYVFVTEIRNGFENFVNFYSTKKLRLEEQDSITQGATPKIGGTTNNLNSAAKVQQNFEKTKENLGKLNIM